jgi:hypothetical protein
MAQPQKQIMSKDKAVDAMVEAARDINRILNRRKELTEELRKVDTSLEKAQATHADAEKHLHTAINREVTG